MTETIVVWCVAYLATGIFIAALLNTLETDGWWYKILLWPLAILALLLE